jgi:hypothetical protein
MTGETVFLGGCPIVRPEGIYLDGHRVIRLGMAGVGVGDVGDLLAYRQMWEPFIAAHLDLWRGVNELFESVPEAQKCPAGIFDLKLVLDLPTATRSFCKSLLVTRMYVSPTYPLGILPQWNAWKGKSSTEILAGAKAMLEWHQSVVMRVGGPYKDELTQIAKDWKIDLQLPDLPTFSAQQELIARIEGAYTTLKGVVQIVGYGVGETLVMAGDAVQATAQGLSDTAKQLPKTTRWIGIAAVVTAVLVGGGLIIYYLPRRAAPSSSPPSPSRPTRPPRRELPA